MNFLFHSLLVCCVLLHVIGSSEPESVVDDRGHVIILPGWEFDEDDATSTLSPPLTSEEDEPTSTTRAYTDSDEDEDDGASTRTRRTLEETGDDEVSSKSTLSSVASEKNEVTSTLTSINSEEDESTSTTTTESNEDVVSSTKKEENSDEYNDEYIAELKRELLEYNRKIAQQELVLEIAGKRLIKTHYSAYLRAWAKDIDWYVGAAAAGENCEQWIIEEHGEKVALKTLCGNKYLRSNIERYVDLADIAQAHELWTPEKNVDRTWSFKGHHDTYLRAQPHGRVSLQDQAKGDEQFRLEEWTEEDTTTTSTTTTTTTTSTPTTSTEEPKTTTFFPASGPVNEVKTNVTIVLMMPEVPSTTTTSPETTATSVISQPIESTPVPEQVNHFAAVRDRLQQGDFTVDVMLILLVVCLGLMCTTTYLMCGISKKMISRSKSTSIDNPPFDYRKVPLVV